MKELANNQPNGQGDDSGTLSAFSAWSAVPITLTILSVAAMIGGQDLALWLRYDRGAILDGQIWRLFTAHIVHAGWSHLAMNIAGLLLIWLLFGRLLTTLAWSITVAVCALGVSGGLLLWQPELEWYVGLSGVLHGMFVAGALASLMRGYRAELLLLGLLALKLIWEQFHGALPGSEGLAGAPVIVAAHLYGAITGLLIGAALPLSARLRRRFEGRW